MASGALLAFAFRADAALLLHGASLVGPIALLEAAGLGSQAWVARERGDRRPDRRLLSSQLASSGVILAGLALPPGAGSFLVLLGLAYRLGALPAFCWAPLLIRHPRLEISLGGALGYAGTAVVLVHSAALLRPLEPLHAWVLALIGATTLVVGFAQALRLADLRCSLAWLAAAAGGALLVGVVSG